MAALAKRENINPKNCSTGMDGALAMHTVGSGAHAEQADVEQPIEVVVPSKQPAALELRVPS